MCDWTNCYVEYGEKKTYWQKKCQSDVCPDVNLYFEPGVALIFS